MIASVIPLARLGIDIKTFDYSVPDHCILQCGQLVFIPFRTKKIIGLVHSLTEQTLQKKSLKAIIGLVNDCVFLPEEYLAFIIELSRVYGVPSGACALMFLPPVQHRSLKSLTCSPALIRQCGTKKISIARYFSCHELHHIIEEQLDEHAQTLILLPRNEDVKTMLDYFPSALCWNAEMSAKQRRETWLAIRNGHSLLIGTRSALFVPMLNRRHIIIVDEESADQKNWDARPRFRTFDIATRLQHIDSSDITIFSKMPRIALFSHVRSSDMKDSHSYVPTDIIFANTQQDRQIGHVHLISMQLEHAIRDASSQRPHTFILVHKTGYARVLRCTRCSAPHACAHCLQPLVIRMQDTFCPHCSQSFAFPESCGICHSPHFTYQLPGIDQVAAAVSEHFSSTHSIITFSAGDDPALLQRDFEKPTIILGTTAAIPYLPYEYTSVYGIFDCASLLALPNYDAEESTLKMILDILCRAHDTKNQLPIQCIIQTSGIEPDFFDVLTSGRLKNWFTKEIASRRMLSYPPYSKLVKISCEAPDADEQLSVLAKKLIPDDCSIFPLFPERDGVKKRYALLLKLHPHDWWMRMQEISAHIPAHMLIDIDPLSLIS